MLKGRYRLARNHRLLPKLLQRTCKENITTHALLNKKQQHLYELHEHPNDQSRFVMFSGNQYLERKCSQVIADTGSEDVIKKIGKRYPQEKQSLAIFIANDPRQANKLIIGQDGSECLLSLAFKDLLAKKDIKSSIMLSVMGIESQNMLTDELFFEWIQDSGSLINSQEPIRHIINSKAKISLSKDNDSKHYTPENVSRHKIDSQQLLHQILGRYGQVKRYLQGWIEVQSDREYYLLGEIYHLCEVECDQQGQITKIIKSHYILRINQYIRTTAPLLLKLGMNLKRIHEGNHKWLDVHDSKVFKVLSECFSSQKDPQKQYEYHLMMQVGQYANFKEQYLCLVPISDFMNMGGFPIREKAEDGEFVYEKNYVGNRRIMGIIADIEAKLGEPDRQRIKAVIKQYEQRLFPHKIRLHTKSYHCQTQTSYQKKASRRHLITEGNQVYPKFDLEELVEETCKIYRLPALKNSQQGNGSNRKLISRMSKNTSKRTILPNLKMWLNKDSIVLKSNKDTIASKQSEGKQSLKKREKGIMSEGKKSFKKQQYYHSQNYSAIRDWLNQVYGKNRDRKVKNYYNSIHRSPQNYTIMRSEPRGYIREEINDGEKQIKNNYKEKKSMKNIQHQDTINEDLAPEEQKYVEYLENISQKLSQKISQKISEIHSRKPSESNSRKFSVQMSKKQSKKQKQQSAKQSSIHEQKVSELAQELKLIVQ